jgi:cell division septal protein FtsQ
MWSGTMRHHTAGARARRRTTFGLPVDGALPPHHPRVVQRRGRLAWLALPLLLLVVVTATVVWRLQHSSYFLVNRVNVTGAQGLNTQAVVTLSGVKGKPIYAVDAAAVAASIERVPIVKTVRVLRVWPNAVTISIEQRKPWGTWQIGGVIYLLDDTGTVIDIVSQPWPMNVYELDAAPGLLPGDHVDVDAVKIAQILVLKLPPVMSQQVAKLEYSGDHGLELVTDHDVRVRIGDGQGLDYKLAVWQALNDKVGASHLHFVDLRSIDRPYYR